MKFCTACITSCRWCGTERHHGIAAAARRARARSRGRYFDGRSTDAAAFHGLVAPVVAAGTTAINRAWKRRKHRRQRWSLQLWGQHVFRASRFTQLRAEKWYDY